MRTGETISQDLHLCREPVRAVARGRGVAC
jgi:hypothetical protein